jgi:hypothetical protein
MNDMLVQNIEKEILLNHTYAMRFFRLRRERTRNPVQLLEDSLPEGHQDTLESAFYLSLSLLTGAQSEMLARFIHRDEIEAKFHRLDHRVDQDPGFRAIGQMEREAAHLTGADISVAALEGLGLGTVGAAKSETAIPCTLMLRTLYETALVYGCNIDHPWEKDLALLVLAAAFSAGDEALAVQKELNQVTRGLAIGITPDVDRERRLHLAARQMAQSMSLQKFVQSIPVIGATGGILNSAAMTRLQTLARCVYKQRYLRNKMRAMEAAG